MGISEPIRGKNAISMKTGDPELMRAMNRFAVLDIIRRRQRIARIEISEQTQLSTTTVSAITAALIEDGLIAPQHEGDLRASNGRGRPRVMLELNPAAARVVGAKVSAHAIVFALVDFRGDMISSLSLSVRVDRQPVGVIADLIEDGVRRCAVDAGLSFDEIEAVCVSLPGIIEHETGLVRSSPILQGTDIDFARELVERLSGSIIVENETDALAAAHHWFGEGRNSEDFLVVSLEQTIGFAMLHEGQLFRSKTGLSSSLGDVVLEPLSKDLVRLSSRAGQSAILSSEPNGRRAAQLADAVRLGQGVDRACELMAEGDNALIDAVMRAGQAVGTVIANMAMLLAPPRVILVGSTLGLGEVFTSALQNAYRTALPAPMLDTTELVFSDCGEVFWARGAASLALRELYESPWSITGPAMET